MKTTICNIFTYKINLKRLMLPQKDVMVCLEWKGETQHRTANPDFIAENTLVALHTIPGCRICIKQD